jgi:protein gp37
MGKNSKIEWTHHTFNPWWGCTRVSEACVHCYAESWSKRLGKKLWGPKAPRRFFGEKHWNEPKKWDAEAAASGVRMRVFCASMADVFEKRRELDQWRTKLWALIQETPNLDWLLLTKRPELVSRMVPWTDNWPNNVWIGTTVEDQKAAETRLPHLSNIPAKVRFISAEPLLGPLDLTRWLAPSIDWVITGGESGAKARPSSPSWFRALLRDCAISQVPYHFKQWGDWAPKKGKSAENQKKRASTVDDGTIMVRIGKTAAGRILDGKTWNGLPRMEAHDRPNFTLARRGSAAVSN